MVYSSSDITLTLKPYYSKEILSNLKEILDNDNFRWETIEPFDVYLSEDGTEIILPSTKIVAPTMPIMGYAEERWGRISIMVEQHNQSTNPVSFTPKVASLRLDRDSLVFRMYSHEMLKLDPTDILEVCGRYDLS